MLKGTFIFYLVFFFSKLLLAQPNTVELKDGGGIVISSHASVTEAHNAIPNPLTQAYIIEILPAYDGSSETFPIVISERAGTSTNNTITLRPTAGNSGEVIATNLNNNPIINLNGIDYFILDGRPAGIGSTPDLLIENTRTTGTSSNTINMSNAATNNVIRYCNIKNNTQGSAGPRTVIFGSSTTTGNNFNILEYNNIIGGRTGVGIDGSPSILNSGNIIRKNRIYNFGFAGIWMLQNGQNTTIQEDEIFQTVGINTAAAYGINLGASGTNGENTIAKNLIYNIQHSSASIFAAIRGIYGTLAAGSIFNINNNFVSLTLDNQNTIDMTGIQFLGANNFTANVYYNTVRIGGNQTGGTSGNIVSVGMQQSDTSAGIVLNLKNNILVNNRTGGAVGVIHAGLNMAIVPSTLDADYNVYFADGGAGAFPVSWEGVTYNDLPTYKSAVTPSEQNTIFKNVTFVSNTNLHLTGSSNGDLDLVGISIPGITDDIDGEMRSPDFPYRGGDEADLIPVELTSFTSSIINNSVVLNWVTATELNNYGFEIERNSNDESGANWKKIGFVPGSGTTTESRSYSFKDENLVSGIYSYRLKQIDFNGSFKYYELNESVEISNPKVFNLAQNYPNPFNPDTKIDYSIANATNVQLEVFNAIGEKVATLVGEIQHTGNYTVNFNAEKFSSGVYIYKLIAGDFVSVKKMLLIR